MINISDQIHTDCSDQPCVNPFTSQHNIMSKEMSKYIEQEYRNIDIKAIRRLFLFLCRFLSIIKYKEFYNISF